MQKINRRQFMQTGSSMLALTALGSPLLARAASSEPVKLGLLHSMTGTIAIAEASLVDAEKLAVEEINSAGGIMGRQIKVVVADGASDNATFAQKAKMLLERDKVAAIVGCYTSSSRKAVLPTLNRNRGLLYYPTYFEGEEEDKQVIYTSQEATQSVVPSIEWMTKEKGKKVFLVGSDYIYPRVCNKIAKATVKRVGGQVMGEEYIPLGNTEFSSIINKIKAANPDYIYSTVVGGSNVAFYKQLKAAGLDGTKPALISTLVTEDEIDGIGRQNAQGFYSCMGYFQSIQSPENAKFLKAFKAKYGQNRVVGDPMECAYNSVYLWKLGAEKAKSFAPDAILAASDDLQIDAPEGTVRIHKKTHYVWKKVRIGRARPDGQFDIVWESKGLIEPNPFPKI
jgi:urea transport system substrate-binding protein